MSSKRNRIRFIGTNEREYIRGQLSALMRAEIVSTREVQLLIAPHNRFSEIPEREFPRLRAGVQIVLDDVARRAREAAAEQSK